MKTLRTYRTFCAAVAMLAATTAPALAQDNISLRVADSFPAQHYVWRNATQPFMDRVTELTDGQVTFEYFPAQQLGKAQDMLGLVQTGVADITYVAPSYISDKFPLSVVGELPWDFSDPCVGTRAFAALSEEGGALHEAEIGPLGIRILFSLMLPPNQLVLSKPIEDPLALDNRKIRSSGGSKDLLLKAAGGVPIQMPAPEIYDAFNRGTVDGMLIPIASMVPYDLHTISKAATFDANFGSFTITYAISDDRWDALPQNVRDALATAGDEITASACKAIAEEGMEVNKVVMGAGTAPIEMTEDQKARLAEMAKVVADDWADGLEQRGLPGKAILSAFEENLK